VTSKSSAASRALLAGLIIAVAGVGGFLAYRQAARTDAASPTVSPVPARALVPAQEPAAQAAADAGLTPDNEGHVREKTVPKTLPDIRLADRDGKIIALSTFGGRPLMVNFWATWCAPCRREIPLLNQLRRERRAQNVEIVGIAVDFRDDVLAFTQKVPIQYPLLIGEEDGLAAAEAFGMGMAFPFSVFVDHQNRIVTVKVGELHEDEANFAFDRLRDIQEGQLTLEAAQEQIAEAYREIAVRRARVEAAQATETAE
jgi:thiol-disulfide isomerase/thioredoxin